MLQHYSTFFFCFKIYQLCMQNEEIEELQDKDACRECAEELIEQYFINLDETDDHGQTALIKAIRGKQIGIAQILLAADVNVTIQDETGRTALHWAAVHELDQVYNMLIQLDTINVDIEDSKGSTALEYLLENKIRSYLMSCGMWQVKIRDDHGSLDAESHVMGSIDFENDDNGYEFVRRFYHFVKQLSEIQKNHDTDIQPIALNDAYYFSESDHKIIADIINVIKTIQQFKKIIGIDGIMLKIYKSVQNYVEQLLTQNLINGLLAKMDQLQTEIQDVTKQLKKLQKRTSV